MTAIDLVLQRPAAEAVAWALLQFVWQGALVAAIMAGVLAALGRSAADIRYVVATIGLAVMLTLPAVTAVQRWQALRGGAVQTDVLDASGTMPAAPPVASATSAAVPSAMANARTESPARTADRLLPVMLLAWIAGVMLLSVRLLTGWLWVQRLRTHGVTVARPAWTSAAARLARRLHISRAVTVLESMRVDVPTVVGWLRPMVLLPGAALAGLTPEQVEAILAHELAHIRRHDYLVNLLQTAVETLLFYHPAVWWLSKRIRIEREHCCDDLAVGLCGDPIAYASALADLASLRGAPLALAATGGSLLHRIRRVLGVPATHAGRGPAWLAGVAATVLVCGIAMAADSGLRQAVTPAPAPQPEPKIASTQRADAMITPAVAATTAPRAATATANAQTSSAQPAVAGAGTNPLSAAAAELYGALASAAATLERAGQSVSSHSNGDSGNWVWSNNGEKLAVTYNGTFEFTDDDADVRTLSAGGSLKISDGAILGRHTVEITGKGGQIERRYYVNGSERPFDPEGRQWLRDNLPRFVRNTGIGAEARVARFLKNGGPAAVLAEIGRIDSEFVKAIYFRQLFSQATLSPDQYRQAMAQASREIDSDFELARVLISVADKLPTDEASRAAYFAAASSIDSDFELARVYSTMLKHGAVSSETLAGILTHTQTIDSDFELSRLLQQIVDQQPLDDRTRPAFFKAVSGIGSDFERGRVLQAVVTRPDARHDTLLAALRAASGMGSGFELSRVLVTAASAHALTGDLRDAYVAAADRLGDFEQGRAMTALVTGERRK